MAGLDLSKFGAKKPVIATAPAPQPVETPVDVPASSIQVVEAPVAESAAPAPIKKFALGGLKLGGQPVVHSAVQLPAGVASESAGESANADAKTDAESTPAPKPAGLVGSRLSLTLTPPAPVMPELPTLDAIPDGPPGFQERLNRLEQLIDSDRELKGPSQGVARQYVQVIMKELVTHPEYDGMVIARDVHNIMVFARSQIGAVLQSVAKKKEKKETSAAKAGAATFDFSGLDALMIAGGTGGAAAKALSQGSLDDLSNLNMDDIPSVQSPSYGKK